MENKIPEDTQIWLEWLRRPVWPLNSNVLYRIKPLPNRFGEDGK